jgi:flavorubredoxin
MPPAVLPTAPHPVTADTWLVPTLAAGPFDAYVGAHTLVIRGSQPVLVDTGCSLVGDAWLDQVASVVDPADVRWIVLSHDDHDHVGNLFRALDACPQATLVASFSIVSRLAGDLELPMHRMRWLNAGESLDLGDRTLTAVQPPQFDSPATRGFFDGRTGLLWAADSFGALVPGAVHEADDVPDDLYAESFTFLNTWNTPWMEWVDADRFAAHLRTTASLPLEVVASAHGPVLRGDRIADAFARTMALVGQPQPATPGQELLDGLLAGAPAAAAA